MLWLWPPAPHRLASVYKSFDSLEELEKEITALREATIARESSLRHPAAPGPRATHRKVDGLKVPGGAVRAVCAMTSEQAEG